jgi:periplasmic divalent cation tolerance protein
LSATNFGGFAQVTEPQCIVVLCTCPEGDAAGDIARALVEDGLAACVNRLPGVVSNFHWQGRVEEERETLLLIKSTPERLEALSARIKALHPYELPEVVAVPVTGGLAGYLDWVRSSVAGASGS